MIRNSLFVSATVLIMVLFGLMSRLDFLAASKKALFLHCGGSIALFVAILGVNLFAATLAINRKILNLRAPRPPFLQWLPPNLRHSPSARSCFSTTQTRFWRASVAQRLPARAQH